MRFTYSILLSLLAIGPAMAQSLFVTAAGVGVNTSNPKTRLDINGGGASLYFNQPTANDMYMRFHVPMISWWTVGTKANGDFWFSNSEFLSTDNRTPLVIKQSGRVGVGTREPISQLHIEANTSAWANEYSRHGLAIRTGIAAQTLYMGYDGTGDIAYINAANGNVIRPIHIQARGGEVRVPGGTNPGNWSTHFNNTSDGRNYIRGTTLMADNGGNVGIGTTNPRERLSVDGKVRARDFIKTSSDWADYVFAPDYKLAPLQEVEAHIKDKRHLPGMPSAAEIEAAGGVELGEMQVNLLAKVEELTLHLIAMEKRIQAQQARIDELENRAANAQPD